MGALDPCRSPSLILLLPCTWSLCTHNPRLTGFHSLAFLPAHLASLWCRGAECGPWSKRGRSLYEPRHRFRNNGIILGTDSPPPPSPYWTNG